MMPKNAASYQIHICMMPKKCSMLSNLHLHDDQKNAASYPHPICIMPQKCGIVPHQISNLYLHDAAKMQHPTSNISA
jgi:hypothetical protein